jgi:hypothetical protein
MLQYKLDAGISGVANSERRNFLLLIQLHRLQGVILVQNLILSFTFKTWYISGLLLKTMGLGIGVIHPKSP